MSMTPRWPVTFDSSTGTAYLSWISRRHTLDLGAAPTLVKRRSDNPTHHNAPVSAVVLQGPPIACRNSANLAACALNPS